MKPRVLLGAFAATALLIGGGIAAEELKSGPQVGEKRPGAFNVVDVSHKVGKSYCQV